MALILEQEVNNATSTANTGAMSDSFSGTLTNKDTDFFKFRADTGGILKLDFTHPNGTGTAGVPIFIEVTDSAGNVVINKTLNGNGDFTSTISAAGDYFIRVADDNIYNYGDGGTYSITPTLSNNPTTVYDGATNNSSATAIVAQLGLPISGSLNNKDTDFFKFRADTGGILKLDFTHPNGTGTAGVPIFIEVTDSAGNVVINKTLNGNGDFTSTISAAGDYFIRFADDNIYNYGDGGTYSITPTLSNNPTTVYDGATNNSSATAIAAQLGLPISGSLNNKDTDFFKFRADTGGILKLDFTHPNGTGTAGVPIFIEITDSAGKVVINKTLNGNGDFTSTISAAGDYFIRVADGNGYNYGDGGIYTVTASLNGQVFTDTTAPTLSSFTPADEATSVSVASNITLTFSEAIARGTGNIVLKTSAGTTIATYDAASSSNLSITGSTLTLNPSADLAAGTAYTLELASGTVKDLAGNNYAGTTSYNFTTASGTVSPPPTLSKDAQYLVLQYASPSIVGAGVGDDTYLISGSMLPAGTSITISDAVGNNSIQLAPGLSIASSQVASSALKLTLDSGAAITILGANNFTYDVGGNTTAGIDQADVSFATLVQNTLKTTLPTSGVNNGGAVVIGSGAGLSSTPVQGNATVNATSASDIFSFDAVAALLDAAKTNTQASISGFSTSADKLQINLPTANAGITTLSQLNGQQGVVVQGDAVNNRTLINFGSDANGGEVVSLTLVGITNPAQVVVEVV